LDGIREKKLERERKREREREREDKEGRESEVRVWEGYNYP